MYVFVKFLINTKWWYISQLLPHESSITNCSRTQGLSAISSFSCSLFAGTLHVAEGGWIQLGGTASGCCSADLLWIGHTSADMCSLWGPGWRGSSYSGHALLRVDPQRLSRSPFKASIHVMSITSLWLNQVSRPHAELIGPGSWFLPKGKGERCEQRVTHYHR